jgi:sugar phosphate isomerase/epimerase
MDTTRRTFLQSTTALAAGAASLPAAKPQHELKAIGVQLYTVRDVIGDNPPKILTQLSDIGYREAECTSEKLDTVLEAMRATKLKAVSVHLDSSLWKKEQSEKLNLAFADAKMKGFDYVVYPYVPPQERAGIEGMKRIAENLTHAAKHAHENGLLVCYHNHAFEFEPMDGTTPFEVLLSNTDPKLVGLELDIFWVVTGGHDPVELIHKYRDRVQMVHLKDRDKPAGPHYNEDVPRDTFKEVGHGQIDIAGVLRAASEAQVKHYFVEQDATPGNPVDSLKRSFEYLRALKF